MKIYGKSINKLVLNSPKDPPFFLEFLRANLCIVKELGDRAAQGRTYGNLGNTYYLLGNFRDAMASHEQVNEMW